jgi:hypothetical protein
MLREPFAAQPNNRPKVVSIGKALTVLTPRQAGRGEVAVLKLQEPIDVTTQSGSRTYPHSYQTIYLSPETEMYGGLHIAGADVYLGDSGHNTAALGTLGYAEGGESKRFVLRIGKQIVKVALDGKNLSLSAKIT